MVSLHYTINVKHNLLIKHVADILNYALTLEHLEDRFYREGLANYTQAQFAAAGFNAAFYQNLQEISFDETTHVNFLTSALAGKLCRQQPP